MDISSQDIVNRIAKLGAMGTAVTAFVGGVAHYALSAPDVAAAITQFVTAAATGPFSWKGALVSGGLALGAKILANAKAAPPTP